MTTDPLDGLRQPVVPIEPRAEFRSDLRRRVATALGRPDPGGEAAGSAQSLIVYLCAKGAQRAIAFYQEAFGAEIAMAPMIGDDGRVGHAELMVGSSRVMISDEYPEYGVLSPSSLGGSSFQFHFEVADSDAVVARAAALGATVERPVEDQFYGDRTGTILDPFGHRWTVATHIEDVSMEEMARRAAGEGYAMDIDDVPVVDLGPRAPAPSTAPAAAAPTGKQGDIFYFALGAPDLDRAVRFFSTLLGWQLEPGASGGAHITNSSPPGGLHRSDEPPTRSIWFRVDDIRAAVAKVRELGGTATEPESTAYGWWSACVDDQGLEFHLQEPSPAYS